MRGVELARADAVPGTAAGERAAPPDIAHPLSLAYISFTSGSTGVPKGVAVPQRAVIRLISDPTFAPLGPGERLLHLSPVAFDASTLEIWGALLTGATVVIAPPGPLGLPDIASLLRTRGVTVVWLTAGLFHQLAETDIDALAAVPVVLAGGDVLNPDTVRDVLAARRGRPLVNGYGPTENTTFTACHVMTDPGQVAATVPIGRPIQHTTVHVLDARGRPVPIGVTGELYTGGDGLARGYAGNAAATARTFVPDPYGHGTRLYRTGDLARWRADGTLEFVGRAGRPGQDPRVPGRARRGRGGSPRASGSAGIGRPRRGRGRAAAPDRLRDAGRTAWIPLRCGRHAARLRRAAAAGLPGTDRIQGRRPVPADRQRQGRPGRAAPARTGDPRAGLPRRAAPPRNGSPTSGGCCCRRTAPAGGDIGREDTFFALGGNSLSAARLMFRIGEVFGVELGLAAFYEAPTLAACAAAIDAARPAAGRGRAPRPRGPVSIGRRDRSAYRVAAPRPAPDRPAELRMVAGGQATAHQEQEG